MVTQKTFCKNQEVLHLVTSTGLKNTHTKNTQQQQNSRPALYHKLTNEVYNCFANYTIKGLSDSTLIRMGKKIWNKSDC